MAPHPIPKGTNASPVHIPLIAQKIAELKKTDLDTVLTVVRKNTTNMYGI